MQQFSAQTMLIVEDSDEDFDSIEWAFKKVGIDLTLVHCKNGDEALDFLYHKSKSVDQNSSFTRPSLIWLDLNLPGTDGRELLEQIKQDKSLRSIPVVIVTSSAYSKDIEFCYQQGANSYVLKPLGLDELVEIIRRLDEFWFKTATLPEKKTIRVENKQRTILIVDDSSEDRETFRRYFKGDSEYEYRFVEEELGENALAACRKVQPSCILVDYQLPDMDGLELLGELLDDNRLTVFPVVVLTGTGDQEIAVQAMKSGAQDYLVKGKIQPENLRHAVDNAIEKWTLQRTLNEQRRELAEKNRELERALESLHLLELGVNQATESILITTADLELPGPQIVFVNNAFEQMTGFTASEAIGKTPRILHGKKTERAVLDDLRAKLSRGEVFYGVTTNYRKDKTEFTLEWSVAPMRNQAGEITHFVAAQHDITERRQAEAERGDLLLREQAARAEAEQANRLKDEFLATLSHELRTPLSSILGWSNLLREGKLSAAQSQHALTVIERNARAQNQLINDLLDVSRIITGKLRLEISSVDFSAIVKAAIDAVRPAAEAKNINLETQLALGAVEIFGDPDRLQQVIWNLLSNAIKFTDKGGNVRVQLERAGSNIRIAVSDTGIGIKPEFLPFVFDRFRQADQTTTRAQSGLGLGLAIVRQLIELHGGSVSVASAGLGLGSTFIVELPLTELRSQIKKESPENSQTASVIETIVDNPVRLDNLKVLVVDDDLDTLELLKASLSRRGADVTTASSTAKALALLAEVNPQVLISDIGLPEEDGYALIKKVRAQENSKAIPAIALTAYAREEDRRQALAVGFQEHLTKPVDDAKLAAAIINLAAQIK